MRKTFLPKVLLLAGIAVLASTLPSDAAHPLITDDTGTQGAGKVQIEANGEYGSDRETALGAEAVERAIEGGITLSYGRRPLMPSWAFPTCGSRALKRT